MSLAGSLASVISMYRCLLAPYHRTTVIVPYTGRHVTYSTWRHSQDSAPQWHRFAYLQYDWLSGTL